MAKTRTRPTGKVSDSIEVEVPLCTASSQWTQFEDSSRFMEGVQSVRPLDEARLLWRAELGGKTVEWEAKITEQIPDLRIAWRSVSGARNSGVVRFDPLADSRCRVALDLEYGARRADRECRRLPSRRRAPSARRPGAFQALDRAPSSRDPAPATGRGEKRRGT